jgi:amino acid efflux transporter
VTTNRLAPPVPRPRASEATGVLSTPRGVALYTGAILGPGLLFLPGLAAAEAGPASVIAWAGLLGLSALFACVFAGLGRAFPRAGGVPGYVAAGLGPRAGAAAGMCFLAGVVCVVPVISVICAAYVTSLTGGGSGARCAIAAVLLLTILALASRGLRTTTTAQLLLVSLLVLVIIVAVAGSAPAAQAASWSPFLPHGWPSVGRAASTLVLSFVGWEAVAPLTGRFRDPGRQLPLVIGTTLAVTTAVYLALAVTTIAVLGKAAGTAVPLVALLMHAAGTAGRPAAVVVAVVLTLGGTNAYVSGALAIAGDAARRDAGDHGAGRRRSERRLLSVIALAGMALLALYGAGLVTTTGLAILPTTLFLTVYLGCTLSAARRLRGTARACGAIGFAVVVTVLAFCGWALAVAVTVAVASAIKSGHAAGHATADHPGTPRQQTVRC